MKVARTQVENELTQNPPNKKGYSLKNNLLIIANQSLSTSLLLSYLALTSVS